jgi:3-hydroxybutyrate dehydrogenase
VVFRVQGTSATPVHEVSFADLRQTQNLDRDAAEKLLLNGKQPTGRLVAPEAVATLIELLCAPESRDLTGAAIPIDGGWSAM